MFWIMSFIFTAIPVGIIMTSIYYLNEHERQPLWMLGLSFGGGFLTFALVRLISNLLNGRVYELSSDSPFLTHNWEFFLIAFGLIAVVEELSKFIIVNVLTFRSRKFQIPYDGIVYAVFVSLGFAFIENFKYLYEQGLGIALSRAIFTIPAHAAFGVVMGYFLGLAKSCRINGVNQDALKMRYTAFFFPLLLHGLYDYICNFNIPEAYYILIAYSIIIYALSFYLLHKFNNLDFEIYQKDVYKPDDILIDYDDDISIQKEKIQERLFKTQKQGDWNVDNQNVQQKNISMKMFAEDDDK